MFSVFLLIIPNIAVKFKSDAIIKVDTKMLQFHLNFFRMQKKIKIKSIFDSIPSQLNDKKRRFMLSHIDEHGRMNRYEDCFIWLSDAGVALPCYNVTAPESPLQLN